MSYFLPPSDASQGPWGNKGPSTWALGTQTPEENLGPRVARAAPPRSLPSAVTWDDGVSRGAPRFPSLGNRVSYCVDLRVTIGPEGRDQCPGFRDSFFSQFQCLGAEVSGSHKFDGCGLNKLQKFAYQLPSSFPWPSPLPHPFSPKSDKQEKAQLSTSQAAYPFSLPSFPAVASSALFSWGSSFHDCLYQAENRVLGPTWQTQTEKPRRQKARRFTGP